MAKKGEITESPIEEPVETPIEEPDLTESEKPKTKAKKKPINIMDSDDSHEPPADKDDKKQAQPIDLSPIMEKIDKGFKDLSQGLVPKESKKTAKEKQDSGFHEDFLGPLGDW